MQWKDDSTLPSRGLRLPISKSSECFQMTAGGKGR